MPYSVNPSTGELEWRDSGGAALDALKVTPDIGGPVNPVADNINLFGLPANTVTTMLTHNVAGDLKVENLTWQTQYVVDTNATVGLRGTFQTIQSAIDQAVLDGMTFNNIKMIYVRPGTYVENLNIQGGTLLVGEKYTSILNGVITPTVTNIVGNHTFVGNAIMGVNNICFTNIDATLDTFSGGDIVLGYFDNCNFASTSTGNHFNIIAPNSTLKISNSTFENTGGQICFTLNTCIPADFYNCVFSQPAYFLIENCNIYFTNSRGMGNITTTTGSSLYIQGSEFFTLNDYNLQGPNLTGTIRDTNFSGANISAIKNDTGLWIVRNISVGHANGEPTSVYEYGTSMLSYTSTQGSVIVSKYVTANTNVTAKDHYIGVTDTSSPITIFLPDGTGGFNPILDQIFIIKDESGAAGANAITITTTNGVKTIDGLTSQLINVNYGSLTVKYNGTNYFII